MPASIGRKTLAFIVLASVWWFGARSHAAAVPNLEGVWANNTVTPFERPPELADRPQLTDSEIATMKARARRLFDGAGDNASGDDLFLDLLRNPAAHKAPARLPTGEYNQFWSNDGLVFEHRTSQIIDPVNGRLPALTPEAAALQRQLAARRKDHGADGPEDRWASERCLTFGTARVGFLQSRNNSYYQIVQTPDYVVLTGEMIHEARIIPFNRPHADPRLRFWSGDGRARWDARTLVIDTTNFADELTMRLTPTLVVPAGHLHLTERLKLLDRDTLEYRVTVDDPTTWTRPWTAATTWRRSSEPMFEYGCHEGNMALEDILRGARAEEREAQHKP